MEQNRRYLEKSARYSPAVSESLSIYDDKWVDLGMAVYQIVTTASRLRDDLNIIVLFHTQTERDENTGKTFTRFLTNGKLMNKVGLEKYFTTVLLTRRNDDGDYVFETKSNNSTVKTPMGAFETDTVPNDMQAVLNVLAEYWCVKEVKNQVKIYPINEQIEKLMGSAVDEDTGELLMGEEELQQAIEQLQMDFDEKIVELRNG